MHINSHERWSVNERVAIYTSVAVSISAALTLHKYDATFSGKENSLRDRDGLHEMLMEEKSIALMIWRQWGVGAAYHPLDGTPFFIGRKVGRDDFLPPRREGCFGKMGEL